MRKLLQLAKKEDRIHRKPLRTFKEMAEEFGVSERALAAYLGAKNGPRPEIRSTGNLSVSRSWYDPAEMRRWWKSIQEPKEDA
jgi:hypothetical protein